MAPPRLLRPCCSHGPRTPTWAFSCPDTLFCHCFPPAPPVLLSGRREMTWAFSFLLHPAMKDLACRGFTPTSSILKCAFLTCTFFPVVPSKAHPTSWHFLLCLPGSHTLWVWSSTPRHSDCSFKWFAPLVNSAILPRLAPNSMTLPHSSQMSQTLSSVLPSKHTQNRTWTFLSPPTPQISSSWVAVEGSLSLGL